MMDLMAKALETIHPTPTVYSRDGRAFTDSEYVRRFFDRRHQHVLEAIRELHCSTAFREANFRETVVRRVIGVAERDIPVIEMTKNGFAFLVMGFNGAKAGQFKEAYIAEFDRKEDELRSLRTAQAVDVNNPAYLRQILLGYTERVLTLETTVADQKEQIAKVAPKAAAWEAYKDSDGLYALSDVGRILGTGPQKTIDWMVSKGVLFRMGRGSPLRPMERYARRGWFVVKSRVIDGAERVQTFATPRGLAGVAEMMGQRLDMFGQIDRSRQGQLQPN